MLFAGFGNPRRDKFPLVIMEPISHPASKGFQSKLLAEHLENVAQAGKEGIESLNLNLSLISKESLAGLAHRIGLLHDIGKASSFFQKKVSSSGYHDPRSRHSLVSAVIAAQNLNSPKLPSFAAPLAFKVIQRHHGNLDSFQNLEGMAAATIFQTLEIYQDIVDGMNQTPEFEAFLAKHGIKLMPLSKSGLKDLLEELAYVDFIQDNTEGSLELFLIANLLFSILIASDKADAARLDLADYQESVLELDTNPKSFRLSRFKNAPDTQINMLRDQFFRHVATVEGIAENQYLYTLTAPTGTGKTLACMNFVDALRFKTSKKPRVLYCLPYTSIIDQNYEVYRELIQHNHQLDDQKLHQFIIRHHHLQNYYKLTQQNEDYDYWDYLNDLLVVGSWSSAMVVSTFVQLFHSLVGNRNSMLLKLRNIINSVVILDEIQNVDPQYHELLRQLFKVLATRFCTYILLCTATKPALVDAKDAVELSPPDFSSHQVFNRVKMTYHPQEVKLSECVQNLCQQNHENLLLVLNTKKAAKSAYQYLKENLDPGHEVFCLTTDHIPNHRSALIKKILRRLKEGARLVLVSTQLLEAGVDISFNVVYRDFAPLDSVVQSSGRCNRHGELGSLGGEFHLCRFTDDEGRPYANWVYDKYLLQQTAAALEGKTDFCSLDFEELTECYFNSLDCKAASLSTLKSIRELDYDSDGRNSHTISQFKLIQDNYDDVTLYLLENEDIEQVFLEYQSIRAEMKTKPMEKEENQALRLRLIQLSNQLKGYRLGLNSRKLERHKQENPHLEQLSENEFYLRPEHVSSAYCKETGFLDEMVDIYNQWQL